jgi:hypothetical protein
LSARSTRHAQVSAANERVFLQKIEGARGVSHHYYVVKYQQLLAGSEGYCYIKRKITVLVQQSTPNKKLVDLSFCVVCTNLSGGCGRLPYTKIIFRA